MIVLLTQYCSDDKIEKNETVVARSAFGGRGEACTGFWWGGLKDKDHLRDSGLHRRIKLRRIFRKWVVRVWAGSSWLRIGTGGGYL